MSSEQRIAKLKELLAKNPKDSLSRYTLALEYKDSGDPHTAIEELEALLTHDANYIPAYHQLGQIYGKLNKTNEAKKIYRKGIDIAVELDDNKTASEMREELEEIEDEW